MFHKHGVIKAVIWQLRTANYFLNTNSSQLIVEEAFTTYPTSCQIVRCLALWRHRHPSDVSLCHSHRRLSEGL